MQMFFGEGNGDFYRFFLALPNSTAIKATTLHLPHLPTPRFSPFPTDLGQARAYSQAFSQPRKLIPAPPVPPGTRQQLFIAIPKPGSNPLCLSPRGKPRFWPGGVGLPPAAGHRSVLSLLTRNIQSGWAAFAIPAIRIDDVQPSPCCGRICFLGCSCTQVHGANPTVQLPASARSIPWGCPAANGTPTTLDGTPSVLSGGTEPKSFCLVAGGRVLEQSIPWGIHRDVLPHRGIDHKQGERRDAGIRGAEGEFPQLPPTSKSQREQRTAKSTTEGGNTPYRKVWCFPDEQAPQ